MCVFFDRKEYYRKESETAAIERIFFDYKICKHLRQKRDLLLQKGVNSSEISCFSGEVFQEGLFQMAHWWAKVQRSGGEYSEQSSVKSSYGQVDQISQ